jgi:hypothetical protein
VRRLTISFRAVCTDADELVCGVALVLRLAATEESPGRIQQGARLGRRSERALRVYVRIRCARIDIALDPGRDRG